MIVADDLTGAADCSVACAAEGLDATVCLGFSGDDKHVETGVLTIDVDTRRMSAPQAASATEEAVRQHLRGPRQLLYKKLDSTLRGHIAVELKGCLRAFREVTEHGLDFPGAFAVVAPAFPALGRTTSAGRQFVKGIPLHATELWKREGLERSANLIEILRQRGMSAEVVGLQAVRSSPASLARALLELGQTNDAVICDAETDDDLRAIAVASLELRPSVMWAGSAGLAHQLVLSARVDATKRLRKKNECVLDGPILFVVGSLSSISRAQVEVLSTEYQVHRVGISPGVLRCEDPSGWNVYRDSIRDALLRGHDVVVQISGDDDEDLRDGRVLAAALAKLIRPCTSAMGSLVLTGGGDSPRGAGYSRREEIATDGGS